MTTHISHLLYLGTYTDLDPYEYDFYRSENASALLGTYSAKTAPLQVTQVSMNDSNYDNIIRSDDGGHPAETLSYDIGAGTVTSGLDSEQLYNATITYGDGSTANVQVWVIQLQNGATFIDGANGGFDNVNIQSFTLTSVAGDTYDGYYANSTNITGLTFVCLTKGTRISVPGGETAVEGLSPGDLLETRDSGPQRLQWIGRQVARFAPGPDRQKPILFPPGSLGGGTPKRNLAVSPQHRMLLAGEMSLRGKEVLSPAKALVGLPGVRSMTGKVSETYYALLMPRHHVLRAEGAWVESLFPGPMAMQALTLLQRRELRRVLSAGRDGSKSGYGPMARPALGPGATCQHVSRLLREGLDIREDRVEPTAKVPGWS